MLIEKSEILAKDTNDSTRVSLVESIIYLFEYYGINTETINKL